MTTKPGINNSSSQFPVTNTHINITVQERRREFSSLKNKDKIHYMAIGNTVYSAYNDHYCDDRSFFNYIAINEIELNILYGPGDLRT